VDTPVLTDSEAADDSSLPFVFNPWKMKDLRRLHLNLPDGAKIVYLDLSTVAAVPMDDHAAWAHVAREISGAFATWSTATKSTPGPWAAAADELSKTAQLRRYPDAGHLPIHLPV
jgi:hypothetical protein